MSRVSTTIHVLGFVNSLLGWNAVHSKFKLLNLALTIPFAFCVSSRPLQWPDYVVRFVSPSMCLLPLVLFLQLLNNSADGLILLSDGLAVLRPALVHQAFFLRDRSILDVSGAGSVLDGLL
jgi:hypothetical protein